MMDFMTTMRGRMFTTNLDLSRTEWEVAAYHSLSRLLLPLLYVVSAVPYHIQLILRRQFQKEFIMQNLEHVPAVIYTLLSCWTRFHDIGKSKVVVWDEAHFGKFGSHYLKREFYFDVHPPLGKMIVGFVGALAGYDGNFDFKSGAEYPANVPFVAMRVMLATFGVGMVPLGWYTAVELGMSQWACHLVALMVLLGTLHGSATSSWY
jgi:dolichyl-phosphate-mannose--protein O-mannosyl transferase